MESITFLEARRVLVKEYGLSLDEIRGLETEALFEVLVTMRGFDAHGVPVADLVNDWFDNEGTFGDFMACARHLHPMLGWKGFPLELLMTGQAEDLELVDESIRVYDEPFGSADEDLFEWLDEVAQKRRGWRALATLIVETHRERQRKEREARERWRRMMGR